MTCETAGRVSLTPRFSGVEEARAAHNRFSDFGRSVNR
jgi:hypothetical protein